MTGARVVGITGSNGKTSAKDLAAAVVGTRLRTHASPASFNNEIGLPMTLLGAEPGVEMVVAEMGSRREGDVGVALRRRPTRRGGRDQRRGGAHGGLRVVGCDRSSRGAKPVEWLGADGTAILNADDPVARSYADGSDANVITFGVDPGADVRAEDIELGSRRASELHPPLRRRTEPVALAVPGEHMVSNALAAAAVGRWAGLTLAECAAALKGAGVARWRMETFTGASGVVVVNDAYNANPESMAAALKAARWMAEGTRLAAVLGHMAELGPIAFEEHERLGELVVRIGVERLVTVGDAGAGDRPRGDPRGPAAGGGRVLRRPDGAAEDVRAWAGPGDVVLLKGSRVAGLERAAEALR